MTCRSLFSTWIRREIYKRCSTELQSERPYPTRIDRSISPNKNNLKTTYDVETKEILDAAQAKMDKVIGFLTEELTSVRAGKASTNILNGIMVDYYGTPTPVSQVASITVPDARTVLVQPWEKKMIAPLEKAILVANIGLTPSNNGEHIRLNIPPLTEERRKELVKQIKGDTETARVSLRGIRRDMVEAFKKAQKEGMPEDVAKDGETSAQKLTDKYMKKVDDLFAAKEAEIMTV